MSSASPPDPADLCREIEELRALLREVRDRLDRLETRAAEVEPAPSRVAESPEPAPPRPEGAATGPDDPWAPILSVLIDAFALALEPLPADADEAAALFQRFLALVHSSRQGSPLLDRNLRTYVWLRLRERAPIYLARPSDPASFFVVRRVPAEIGPRTETAKVFLQAATRLPVPVTLRPDEAAAGAWRIEASSL